MSMTARPLPEQWRVPVEAWQRQLEVDGFAEGTIRDRIRAVRRAAQAFAGCPWDVTAERLTTYAGQQSWSEDTRGTWLRTVRLFYEYAVTKGWTDRTPTPDRHAALVRMPAATVWHVLDDLAGWLGSLDVAPNTRRALRQAIRAFYRWGMTTGRVRVDPSAELPAVRARRAVPRPAPEDAIVHALQKADPRVRDAIELAAITGLRRSEIAAVHTRDVVRYPDGWTLRILGKGGQVREVPLPPELGDRLAARPAGFVFPNGPRGGHLTPAHLGGLMSKVLPPGWTPHTLRHRFATRAYTAERDIMAVRDLLGHATVSTTQIYTAVPDGAKRAAVAAAASIAG